MIELSPLRFTPYFKSVIWGGKKIGEYKAENLDGSRIGESWEISAIPGHESVVAEGRYKGMRITDLIERYGESLLGSKVMICYGGRFPLLIKIIDAADNLSVQVHPCEELARKRHGCSGKTEMWYVIHADSGAKIYAGFSKPMSTDQFLSSVADGSFAQSLKEHESRAGDVYFIPAGRVHAIGAGNLLAEIQESSDITYRIYDYDRRDADGKPRELHTAEALDAIDFSLRDDTRTDYDSESNDVMIADCPQFSSRRLSVDGERQLTLGPESFTVMMCIEGQLDLIYPGGEMTLTAGHTVLLPSALPQITLRGHSTILITRI